MALVAMLAVCANGARAFRFFAFHDGDVEIRSVRRCTRNDVRQCRGESGGTGRIWDWYGLA